MSSNKRKVKYIDADIAPYRFDSFNEKANLYLDKKGFCVIKNVLNHQEIIESRKLLWNFLSSIGWNKNYPNTWNIGIEEGHSNTGIFWGHGISQSKLHWKIKKNKKLLNIFAKLWNQILIN